MNMDTDKNTETERLKKEKKKDNSEFIRNIVYSLKPLFLYGLMFGIFRYQFKNNELQTVDWKRKCLGICIALVFAGCYMFYLSRFTPSAITTIAAFIIAIEFICSSLGLIGYIAAVAMPLLMKSSVHVQIISNLADIDSRLHFSMKDNFYDKARKYNFAIVFGIFFVNMSYGVWFFKNNEIITVVYYVLVDSVYLIQDVEISLFCVLICMLKFRLTALNRNLQDLVKPNDMCKIFVCSFPPRKEQTKRHINPNRITAPKLYELSLIYDAIGETCSLINNLFNFQIFMALVMTFGYILITMWTLLFSFYKDVIIGEIVSTVVLSGIKLSYVMVLSLVCEWLVSARDRTQVLVNALVMDYSLPARARAQAKAFMRLVDAWPLRVHVYDMFSVDISLMLKFISVSTTYLIIIIQITHFV